MTKAIPWAHGHQIKGICAYIEAILQRQSGKQAELARGMGNQEAAVKRLSRLIHNERLDPAKLANALLVIAVAQLPSKGKVRLTLDWTIEGDQHLLVISLGVGRRAIPIFWRAYDARVLKGRMKRYEAAILKRVFTTLRNKIAQRRIRVTMDRGFADVSLCDVFEAFAVEHLTRTKASTKVLLKGQWRQFQSLSFTTNSRKRNLGKVNYCESSPHQVYASLSRVKNEKGEWEVWYLISNRKLSATQMAHEYARRFGCEEGFRDAKWLLGFAQARIQDIKAWSRFFALFAFAMLILITLATRVLLKDPTRAKSLLRLVASRRKARCELSLLNAMLKILQQLPSLLSELDPNTKLDLQAQLLYVS